MDIVKGLEAIINGFIKSINSDTEASHYAEINATIRILREAVKEIVRLRGDVRRKIVDKMNEYVKATGKQPTRIFLTKVIENEMLIYSSGFVSDFTQSVRDTYPDILFGIQVIWDAEEFKVDRPENLEGE